MLPLCQRISVLSCALTLRCSSTKYSSYSALAWHTQPCRTRGAVNIHVRQWVHFHSLSLATDGDLANNSCLVGPVLAFVTCRTFPAQIRVPTWIEAHNNAADDSSHESLVHASPKRAVMLEPQARQRELRSKPRQIGPTRVEREVSGATCT